MKCANCQMLNNTPETPCTHCGRMLPALKPIIITKEKDDAEGESSGVSTEEGQSQETGQTQETEEVGGESPTESGQAETSAEAEAPPVAGSDAEVDLEKGHVDNVGDESESETIT